jgi:hypothetical protein
MGTEQLVRRVLTVCIFAGALVTAPASAQALPSAVEDERHCVLEVIDERDGALITGPERCYDTFLEAQANVQSSAATAGDDAETSTASFSSNTIGVHFTGTSYTGSSVTISGTVCSGGVWWPTGSWNDNLASSYHYCGSSPTRFYDSSTCSGTSHSIYSAASTLYSMNDRASCVRYG